MTTDRDFDDRCQRLLIELGLCLPGQPVTVTPLTGGVASDIARVTVAHRSYCVKFALAQLKVAAEWHAPVHRNLAEYSWLTAVARILPDAVPALYGRSAREGGFAMEYIAGDDIYLWKAALLAARPDRNEAAQVGAVLGQIHAASSEAGFDAAPFRNGEDFHALRLEPYLLNTARHHAALSERLTGLVARLHERADVLVHGDVSPKNILFRGGGPVLLDAECATMGDASFDVAFCLNHLVLKALHLPQIRGRLLRNVLQLWASYAAHIRWEDPLLLEARVSELLPALMLARVDGKSPVEYLSVDQRDTTRRTAIPLITNPPARLADLIKTLTEEFEGA
jgi:aminoglycoside phosphotransferase (APT) family kinase protein